MLKKECCKQCRYVKFNGTMTKWPVQATHRTTRRTPRRNESLETPPPFFVFFGFKPFS